MTKQNILRLIFAVNAALLLANGIWMWSNARRNGEVAGSADQFPYLSKRIFAENQNDILINFTPLRAAMHEYIGKQPDQIGSYFEYLPSGTSIGVNDQMEAKIVSLIKVPIVMAVYKEVEASHLSLGQILTVQEKDLDQLSGKLWEKGPGAALTVEEAIRLSLVESDNTAARVLHSVLPVEALDKVFDALDISTDQEGIYTVISPKSYTSILRSLYLSSYLERNNSNATLTFLTKTKFQDKLAAGVPPGIPVAHKIGVFNRPEKGQVFSDCAIVYVPARPYTLCIMVNGTEESARQHMQLLSKMVYGYIEMVQR